MICKYHWSYSNNCEYCELARLEDIEHKVVPALRAQVAQLREALEDAETLIKTGSPTMAALVISEALKATEPVP